MYFAPRFGSNICSFCRCSKNVMFSITFCASALQNTLCVTYGAPRRSLPSRFWAALWPPGPPSPARNSGQPRPAWILAGQGRHGMSPHHFVGPHREQSQTSQVGSSVVGCAMHMKWPDGIGRGSWDWENPRQESANEIPALPVLLLNTIYTYIYCCWSG